MTGHRFDPFRVLSEDERAQHRERYARYQMERNGEIDLGRRSLSLRESYFSDLGGRSVSASRTVDVEALETWISRSGRPALDDRGLFLVIVAMVNESERYGVDLELDRFDKSGEHLADRTQLYLFLEEGYHSRILVEVCRTFGVELELRTPPWSTRWLIQAVRYLPDSIRWIPVLCGEVVGCTVFRFLIDRSTEIFASEPAVQGRVRSLLYEIWQDEVMHVAFLRSRLGARAIRLSRAMLPMVARSLTWDVPALGRLGCPFEELMRRIRSGVELPPEVDWVERRGVPRGSLAA